MGSGSTKFGVPTNPRVEYADTDSKSWQRKMEIDTPSLIKLSHGAIRYREPQDHRKPVLPRYGKPTEAPHEGKDRVGKSGYFYHPYLSDFSEKGKYTKEDAARFHYVQKTSAKSQGRKVFFVVGVGMPKELPPEEKIEEGPTETLVEDIEAENKENAVPEASKDSTEVPEAPKEDGDDSKEGEENNDANENKSVDEKKEEIEKPNVIVKEFRGPLIPRSCVPQTNELPVRAGKTKVICMTNSQVYYKMEFTEPVVIDQGLAASRTNLFRTEGASTAETKEETQDTTNDSETPEAPKDAVKDAEKMENVKESETPKTDETNNLQVEVLADGSPPTLGIIFTPTVTVADVRYRLSSQLDVTPQKINILYEDKYISSRCLLSEFAQGELHEGYRHRVILSPY